MNMNKLYSAILSWLCKLKSIHMPGISEKWAWYAPEINLKLINAKNIHTPHEQNFQNFLLGEYVL